jgi:Fe-S cluster assembly iron-binding protein IscA
MFLWGSRTVERCEERGDFICPRCRASATYSIWRNYSYLHVYFIPLLRQRLLSEHVVCDSCFTPHPITVLVGRSPRVGSAFEAGQESDGSIQSTFGNVVFLSETAEAEIVKRRLIAGFGPDLAVRITPSDNNVSYAIEFDDAIADGRDWIGESRGIAIVVDRRDAPLLLGKTIDFCNGSFCDALPTRR